jgi:hypothetical protein
MLRKSAMVAIALIAISVGALTSQSAGAIASPMVVGYSPDLHCSDLVGYPCRLPPCPPMHISAYTCSTPAPKPCNPIRCVTPCPYTQHSGSMCDSCRFALPGYCDTPTHKPPCAIYCPEGPPYYSPVPRPHCSCPKWPSHKPATPTPGPIR